MIISTDRILLRNYLASDWERAHEYGKDPEFSKYEFWGPNTEEDTQKFISESIVSSLEQPRTKFECAIVDLKSGLFIGGCGLRIESPEKANVGWAIHPAYQNKGFATEAAKALLQLGFHQLHLKTITATCDVRNIASYRVMEKNGMKRIQLILSDKIVKGHMRDTAVYEIHHSEYQLLK